MNLKQAILVALSAGVIVGGVALASESNDTDPLTSITEDSPGWSCVDDGNHVCGPGNSEGKPAGCYDAGGVMVEAWPCYVVSTGNNGTDVYTPERRQPFNQRVGGGLTGR